jgi:hypothetical protein
MLPQNRNKYTGARRNVQQNFQANQIAVKYITSRAAYGCVYLQNLAGRPVKNFPQNFSKTGGITVDGHMTNRYLYTIGQQTTASQGNDEMTLANAQNEAARLNSEYADNNAHILRMEKIRRGKWTPCTNEDGSVCYAVRFGRPTVVVDDNYRFVPVD